MEKRTLKLRIKQNPALKQAVHRFIMHPVKTRPNWWIRLFYFVYLKRGKGSVIYRSVRKDLPPFNQFSLGRYSVVEDFSCLNNAVGDLYNPQIEMFARFKMKSSFHKTKRII